MLGFGSMGSGIGLGMGIRVARPNDTVVTICGDGGLAMHAGEILTCVEQKIGIVLVVMNDGRYNIVDHGFHAVFGRVPQGLPSQIADVAGVARHFGAAGVRVRSPHDLDPARLRELAASGRPLVLDVLVDPSAALSVTSRTSTIRQSAFGGAK